MVMMEYFLPIIALLIFLSCIFISVYSFYKAIRSFIGKNIWQGVRNLLLSLLLGFIVFSVVIAVNGARERSQRCLCSNHLMNIVLFLKMYAADHQETYPDTFNGLMGDYVKPTDTPVFVCPSSHHKNGSLTNIHEWTDYAYVSGLSEADPPCVVAFCLPENHRGEGASVAFLGRNVQWYSCTPYKDSTGKFQPTFQDLTNTPSLFYGTTDENKLADLKKRTRIIYPKKVK